MYDTVHKPITQERIVAAGFGPVNPVVSALGALLHPLRTIPTDRGQVRMWTLSATSFWRSFLQANSALRPGLRLR